jgi:uncharacterized membrane protein
VIPEKQFGPIVTAGLLIGAGFGGLVDAIFFRQILHLHTFLSTKVPVKGLPTYQTNLLWDGILQVLFLILIVSGIAVLFHAGRKTEVPWSGQLLFGSWFLGWGTFTLVEGLLSHHLFKLHHFLEYSNPATQETGDYSYLGAGVLLGVLGYWAVSTTRSELEERERTAIRSVQRAKEVKGDRKVYLD